MNFEAEARLVEKRCGKFSILLFTKDDWKNFSVITMALSIGIAQSELKLRNARIKRIRQCFIIHMVQVTSERLVTIQDEIDKIKFKRIFQRKTNFCVGDTSNYWQSLLSRAEALVNNTIN